MLLLLCTLDDDNDDDYDDGDDNNYYDYHDTKGKCPQEVRRCLTTIWHLPPLLHRCLLVWENFKVSGYDDDDDSDNDDDDDDDDDDSDNDDDDATYITCMNVAITYQHTNHINHLVITTVSISTSIFFIRLSQQLNALSLASLYVLDTEKLHPINMSLHHCLAP